MSLAQITLTERCSLKCKKCAHACYNVGNQTQDLDLSEVYKSADMFFSKVDYINEFVLIGGEPLLYKGLSKAIVYIGNKYRSQICCWINSFHTATCVVSHNRSSTCKCFKIGSREIIFPRRIDKCQCSRIQLLHLFDIFGSFYANNALCEQS